MPGVLSVKNSTFMVILHEGDMDIPLVIEWPIATLRLLMKRGII